MLKVYMVKKKSQRLRSNKWPAKKADWVRGANKPMGLLSQGASRAGGEGEEGEEVRGNREKRWTDYMGTKDRMRR